MILSQRHLFEIPDDVAYLNCAYMGPLPKAAREAGERGMARKARPWTITPADFFTDSETARSLFAGLINARADDIAIVPAASYGIAVAAANIAIPKGRRALILADQFPSNVYAWRERAAQDGGEVATVDRPADDDWTAAVLARLDERVAVVSLPHCHWTDGGLLDLARIGERARAVGAALVLDVTQSLGALPLDVAEVRPDYLVAAAYKWLLGPYSFGFLYVAPHRHEGRALEHGWITRGGAEDFSGLVAYRDDHQPGARRYDMGERANFAATPAAIESLKLITAWSVGEIQATLAARTGAIAARAAKLGLSSAAPERRAGHFLGLRFPGGVPADLPARLAAERIFVSVRGTAMRVTPHLYNTDADVDRLFDVLARVV